MEGAAYPCITTPWTRAGLEHIMGTRPGCIPYPPIASGCDRILGSEFRHRCAWMSAITTRRGSERKVDPYCGTDTMTMGSTMDTDNVSGER